MAAGTGKTVMGRAHMDLGEFKTGGPEPLRLNLGCGKHPMPGWVNVDQTRHGGVDKVLNLDATVMRLPWADDTVDEIYSSHMIEHIHRPLILMRELWRVCRPDARATFACPYGSSDDAWENPTHVRPMFVGSWGFFGQPNYWREDYGYRGDWALEEVRLSIPDREWRIAKALMDEGAEDLTYLWRRVREYRNVVAEMAATLRCNKPARPAVRELQDSYDIVFYAQTPVSPWEHEVTEVGRLRAGVPTDG